MREKLMELLYFLEPDIAEELADEILALWVEAMVETIDKHYPEIDSSVAEDESEWKTGTVDEFFDDITAEDKPRPTHCECGQTACTCNPIVRYTAEDEPGYGQVKCTRCGAINDI